MGGGPPEISLDELLRSYLTGTEQTANLVETLGDRFRPLPSERLRGIRRQLSIRSTKTDREARLIFLLDEAIVRQVW